MLKRVLYIYFAASVMFISGCVPLPHKSDIKNTICPFQLQLSKINQYKSKGTILVKSKGITRAKFGYKLIANNTTNSYKMILTHTNEQYATEIINNNNAIYFASGNINQLQSLATKKLPPSNYTSSLRKLPVWILGLASTNNFTCDKITQDKFLITDNDAKIYASSFKTVKIKDTTYSLPYAILISKGNFKYKISVKKWNILK